MADIILGGVAEFARAHRIEAEGDNGLAGLLIETGAGIGEPVARHHHPALDQNRGKSLTAGRRVGHRQQLVFRRHCGRVGIGGFIHHLKAHLGGLAQDGLELGGILQARDFHHDAVVTLSRDSGLAGAHFVDAAVHHFQRLFQHLLMRLGLVTLGHGQGVKAALLGDVVFLHPSHRQYRAAAQGRIDAVQHTAGLGLGGGIGHPHLHHIAIGAEIEILDMRLAQPGANIADGALRLVALHLGEIHFQQQVGTALEVQPQAHRVVR